MMYLECLFFFFVQVTPPGAGRKIVAQKKRLKWSKSRQSSFEHLLPNVQEESAVEGNLFCNVGGFVGAMELR